MMALQQAANLKRDFDHLHQSRKINVIKLLIDIAIIHIFKFAYKFFNDVTSINLKNLFIVAYFNSSNQYHN